MGNKFYKKKTTTPAPVPELAIATAPATPTPTTAPTPVPAPKKSKVDRDVTIWTSEALQNINADMNNPELGKLDPSVTDLQIVFDAAKFMFEKSANLLGL